MAFTQLAELAAQHHVAVLGLTDDRRLPSVHTVTGRVIVLLDGARPDEPLAQWLADWCRRAIGISANALEPVRGPIVRPDGSDPLVAARRLPVQLVGGPLLDAEHPVALDPPQAATVLATLGDAPVAWQAYGDGVTLTAIGCASLLADGQLLHAGPLVQAALGVPAATMPAPDPHPLPRRVDAAGMEALEMPLWHVGEPEFVRHCAHQTRRLPAAVHDALVDFTVDSHPSGALLLTGVALGEVGRTPSSPRIRMRKDARSELGLLTVASRLGHAIGYAPEHGGDLVQNIVPTEHGQYRQVSTSSGVTLAWHTEAAFHPHRPRYLALLCLRGDPAAATMLCSVRALVAHMSPELQAVLREPRFHTAVDESYLGSRPTRWGIPRPIITGPPGAEALWYDADLMRGLDPDADAALADLYELVDAHHVAVTLATGELLVVDNEVAVHGRTPFTPRFDGTDRWLQRSFVATDLAPSAADRHGRIVATHFLP